jgi:hypothetical protein
MTAEIAAMNRMGVALAADSAVTIGESGNKIYTSAEKLFQLSEVAPVGIMVYGNAGYALLPWETIIKAYRKKLGTTVRSTIQEYCDDFTDFLRDNAAMFPKDNRLSVMKGMVFNVFCDVHAQLRKLIQAKRKANVGSVQTHTREQLAEEAWPEALAEVDGEIKDHEEIEGLDNAIIDQTKTDVGGFIGEVADKAFQGMARPPDAEQKLFSLAIDYLMRPSFGRLSSGIVIAGFGEQDYMPALASFDIEQCIGILPRRGKVTLIQIGTGRQSFVMPYAQQDSVFHFLFGVDMEISSIMEKSATQMTNGLVDAILDKVGEANSGLASAMRDQVKASVNDKLRELFDEWSTHQSKYFHPVLDTIAVLPKDELAEMAEAFVNLTKFRRRITPELETVSGPIDVAVITKGDGFVWIKRKHYFKPEMNPRLMARFCRLGEGP